MLELLLVLIVLGVVLWLVETYLPMPQPIKVLIYVVVVIFIVILLFRALGVPIGLRL